MERGARGPDWGQRIEGLTSDGEGECVFVWQFHQMVKYTAPSHCLLTDSCGGVQNSFANMWLGKQSKVVSSKCRTWWMTPFLQCVGTRGGRCLKTRMCSQCHWCWLKQVLHWPGWLTSQLQDTGTAAALLPCGSVYRRVRECFHFSAGWSVCDAVCFHSVGLLGDGRVWGWTTSEASQRQRTTKWTADG